MLFSPFSQTNQLTFMGTQSLATLTKLDSHISSAELKRPPFGQQLDWRIKTLVSCLVRFARTCQKLGSAPPSPITGTNLNAYPR